MIRKIITVCVKYFNFNITHVFFNLYEVLKKIGRSVKTRKTNYVSNSAIFAMRPERKPLFTEVTFLIISDSLRRKIL